MAKLLDRQRYKCALGAMQTVQAIERALPVLHSGPGCAQKLSDSTGSSGYFSPNIFPCTSINEKDVVFGGVKKLDSTIANSLKVIDAIIDQYLTPSDDRQDGLINIFADVPYQDLFWLGNIRELERLIKELGLTPNTIFGYRRGIDNINKIPHAKYNLLVSPWVGINNMKKMEKKLGIPYLHYKTLPIGATETSRFLRTVGEFAGVSNEKVESVIKEHEDYYYYLIERYADLFLENRVINKQFSVVADAHYALAITRFLVNDLGLVPAKQFITDDTPKNMRDDIVKEFNKLNYGLAADVSFETDTYKIHEAIREHDYHGYPLILGGYYEKELTEELKGNFLNISWPVQDKVVFDSFYAGYAGGIRLIEDIYTVAVSRFN